MVSHLLLGLALTNLSSYMTTYNLRSGLIRLFGLPLEIFSKVAEKSIYVATEMFAVEGAESRKSIITHGNFRNISNNTSNKSTGEMFMKTALYASL